MIRIAILTISDTRTMADDKSGATLAERIEKAGHAVGERKICKDDKYAIRAIVSQWIVDKSIDAVITTGGTGVTGRDGTPEAVAPLLDKQLEGFGEIFRWISFQELKTSAIQTRAIAGVADQTYIFCLPGSVHACTTAWDNLIAAQLDSTTKPCNLAQLMPRLRE
jgi:molybdenum cofactor biosynthesis protein B